MREKHKIPYEKTNIFYVCFIISQKMKTEIIVILKDCKEV